ncbi:hypothetical protein FRC17_009444, partial [Serendipita sp. 399]
MGLGPPNMERHERWILIVIIISMFFALIELGISFGDSLVGGYSYWTAPACSISTLVLHSVTIPLWKSTAKKRQGTRQPPFIYSITLHVLTCLLAVLWFASVIMTFIVASALTTYNDGHYYPGRRYNPSVGYVEAVFALFNSLLLWLFFAFIVHYRKWFLRTGGNSQPEPTHPAPPHQTPPRYTLVVYHRRWFMRIIGKPEPEPPVPDPLNPPPNPDPDPAPYPIPAPNILPNPLLNPPPNPRLDPPHINPIYNPPPNPPHVNPIYNPPPNPPPNKPIYNPPSNPSNSNPIYNPGPNLGQPSDLPPKSDPSPNFNSIPNPGPNPTPNSIPHVISNSNANLYSNPNLNPNPATGLETHLKWILGIIATCMVLCIIEFGISLGDGAFGGFSLWLAVVSAVLTVALHCVTLPVWKKTIQKRRGTSKPPFIYSITLCVLSCLLAILWFVASILAFILTGSKDAYSKIGGSVGYAEGVFALFLSGLMWAEFGLVVHNRKRFLKRVKQMSLPA